MKDLSVEDQKLAAVLQVAKEAAVKILLGTAMTAADLPHNEAALGMIYAAALVAVQADMPIPEHVFAGFLRVAKLEVEVAKKERAEKGAAN